MLSGLSGEARAYLLNEIQQKQKKILCLVPSEEKAYDLANDLTAFAPDKKVFLFLARDLLFMKENSSIADIQRILTLTNLVLEPEQYIYIISTPGALLYHIMSPRELQERLISLEVETEISIEALLKKLLVNGYERVDTVTRCGEIAVRGGIIDIFPPGAGNPCRIELFGDEIESIRRFDLSKQTSLKKEKKIIIGPADEICVNEPASTLLNYIQADTLVFFDEQRDFYKVMEKNKRRYKQFVKEAQRENKKVPEISLLEKEEISEWIKNHVTVYHSFFPGSIEVDRVDFYEHISQQEMEPFYRRYESFFTRVKEWREKNYTVKLFIGNEKLRQEMKKELLEAHISGVDLIDARIEKGFLSQSLKLAILSEKDIWGKKISSRRKKQKKNTEERVLLEDLKKGDYVVHESYGIGIFRGVTLVETDDTTREYILLQYAGTDKLYLPVDKMDLLYRYSSSGEKEPRLSKLGGTSWEKTKNKVAKSIQDMAEELLNLYASRESMEGYAFSPDTPWQRQFEDDFAYQETPDQLRAINDVKKDMECNKAMERLVCGDVGYGKTEVALRAVFKAVMEGKQVAVLVPTTILAEQHYEVFKERFTEYPTNVEALSRFRTAAQQKKIIADLGKGVIDIVIATHRLLSRDIKFNNLGLLVIDEEHRFGVAQKEKIKVLRKNVDVLSLSATPIPRSLHMALTGLRDLSVIETPPPERYPVTTYVLEYNEEIIKDAVQYEIERGGQVFFVHNRISDIYKVKEEIEAFIPGVSITVGHGRMKEDELSANLMDFIKGKYSILLCTTIIESGLDMPKVNTIIIDNADKMGLAQLYQLRGRVGRSDKIAYAYITYRPDKVISEEAQKRLNAIREFNELGAGMKIALRDLEIRGAGNLLGAEQHGQIYAVGFDLYCRLLEKETKKLKGNPTKKETNPQLDIDLDYYIPDSYIPDSGTKMRLYRRLLLAENIEEIEETREEIHDRFGNLPHPVENFLQMSMLRISAKDKQIKAIRRKNKEIEIQLAQKIPVNFNLQSRGLEVKKINDNTLLLKGEKTSLADLKLILDNI